MKKKIKPYLPPILLNQIDFLWKLKKSNKYKRLISKNEELRNIHCKKRCFIIGSGGSIKKNNLKLLKDEIVFAANNLYVHPDYQTFMQGPISKYHIIAPIHLPQTETEWVAWFTDIQKNVSNNVKFLLGLSNVKINIKYILDKHHMFENYTKHWYFAGILKDYNSYTFKPQHIDPQRMIWEASTVSIYALILAIFMGFKEIYLLGMDHDYFLYDNESEMRFYKKAIHQKDEFKRSFGDSFYTKEFLRQYQIFSDYDILKSNSNAKIYNASSGGILKNFPRIKYDELF